MGTASTDRASRVVIAAGAVALMIGLGAGPVAAQDQHSGGTSPNQENVDPGGSGAEASQAQSGGGGLPVTGSDVAGLVGLGVAAVAIGSGAVVVSKRRSQLSA